MVVVFDTDEGTVSCTTVHYDCVLDYTGRQVSKTRVIYFDVIEIHLSTFIRDFHEGHMFSDVYD